MKILLKHLAPVELNYLLGRRGKPRVEVYKSSYGRVIYGFIGNMFIQFRWFRRCPFQETAIWA